MFYLQVVIDLVLIAAVGYLYYPIIKEQFSAKEIEKIRTVFAKRSNPVCPTCKNELIGQVYKSASGQMCCHTCFVTVYGNK